MVGVVDVVVVALSVLTATAILVALYYRREVKTEQRANELLMLALKRSGVELDMSTTKDGQRLVVAVALNTTARSLVIEQFLSDLETDVRHGIGEVMERVGDDKVGEMLERPTHLATLGFERSPEDE